MHQNIASSGRITIFLPALGAEVPVEETTEDLGTPQAKDSIGRFTKTRA